MSEQIDPNAEAVRALIASRAAAGLAKYGTDTTRQDISTEGWITHAQEEAADLCVYLQRLKSEIPILSEHIELIQDRDKWRRSAEAREVRIHELRSENEMHARNHMTSATYRSQLKEQTEGYRKRIAELQQQLNVGESCRDMLASKVDQLQQQLSGKQSDAPDPGEGFRLLAKCETVPKGADFWSPGRQTWDSSVTVGAIVGSACAMDFYRVPIEKPEPAKEPDELRDFKSSLQGNLMAHACGVFRLSEIIARRFDRIEERIEEKMNEITGEAYRKAEAEWCKAIKRDVEKKWGSVADPL